MITMTRAVRRKKFLRPNGYLLWTVLRAAIKNSFAYDGFSIFKIALLMLLEI
jgi:hypothetical protein